MGPRSGAHEGGREPLPHPVRGVAHRAGVADTVPRISFLSDRRGAVLSAEGAG